MYKTACPDAPCLIFTHYFGLQSEITALPGPSTVDFPPCYIPISLATENAMPIPQELLDILVCPVCKTPVKLAPDNSSLKCQSTTCRRVYPVRDDIPVMLPEEAKIAPE